MKGTNILDYLAYLIKQYLPFLFPVMASAAQVLTAFRFGKVLSEARAQGTLDGLVDDYSAKIRPLGIEDVEALGGFLRALSKKHLEHFQPHGFDDVTLKRTLGSRAVSTYGLFVEDRFVGYSLLKLTPTGSAYIGFMVSHGFTGLGIGTYLVKYLFWQTRLAGLRARSTVSKSNHASLRAHQSVASYRVLKELPNDYLMLELPSEEAPAHPPVLQLPARSA